MEANKNLQNLKNRQLEMPPKKQTIIIGYQVSPLRSQSDCVKMKTTKSMDIKMSNKSRVDIKSRSTKRH